MVLKKKKIYQLMKIYDNESYEDVIWDLIEDRLELSEGTKKNIEKSEKEFLKDARITNQCQLLALE